MKALSVRGTQWLSESAGPSLLLGSPTATCITHCSGTLMAGSCFLVRYSESECTFFPGSYSFPRKSPLRTLELEFLTFPHPSPHGCGGVGRRGMDV